MKNLNILLNLVSQIFYHTQKVVRSNNRVRVRISKYRWKIISTGLQIKIRQSFGIAIHIWSRRWALLASKFWIIFAILSVEKVIDEKLLFVKYLDLLGSSLLLLVREHWCRWKELKSLAYSLKSITDSFLSYSWNNRVITRSSVAKTANLVVVS